MNSALLLVTTLVIAFAESYPQSIDYNIIGDFFHKKEIPIEKHQNIFSDEFITSINEVNSTWKAGRNFHEGFSLSHLKRLIGVHESRSSLFKTWFKVPTKWDRSLSRFTLSLVTYLGLRRFFRRDDALSVESYNYNSSALPDNFDARDRWPDCPMIKEVTDQGACQSCWAFSAVGAMSDRICIHSNATVRVHLSAEDVVSCSDNNKGCNGGGLEHAAWSYWVQSGIVTGGSYGSNQGCEPYEFPPIGLNLGRKSGRDVKTPKCIRKCQSNYELDYEKDKHYGVRAYKVPNKVDDIRSEIFTRGPVQATIFIYGDIAHYKSGIYQHEKGRNVLGAHSVRIIGWGVQNDVPYWLAVNSWGNLWGESGTFKIKRGNNECGIEEGIIAGIPKL